MPVSPNAQYDRSSDLDVLPAAPWRVTHVQVLPDYTLQVTFVDGVSGIVHMAGLVQEADAGVFAALRDPDVFAQVFISCGAVTWPGDIDLAPDAMYDAIRADGKWVL